MESIVKSDIFFFVTTLCVIAITVFLVMILINIFYITKNIRGILDTIQKETDDIENDIATLRTIIKENQFGLKPLLHSLKKKKEEVVNSAHVRVQKVQKAAAKITRDFKKGQLDN